MYGVGSRGGPSDHPAGNAVDFMIEEYRTPPGRALGWQVAEWMVAHHQTLGVKYVIFDMQIWSASQADAGWRPYTRYGPDPDDNLAHRNPLHVTVKHHQRPSAGRDSRSACAATPPGAAYH
jgi:hypothetical protein